MNILPKYTKACLKSLRASNWKVEGFKKQAFVDFDKYDKNIVLCQ